MPDTQRLIDYDDGYRAVLPLKTLADWTDAVLHNIRPVDCYFGFKIVEDNES